MTTTQTPAELAADIQAAVSELADGRRFPDLVDAIDRLAAMAATPAAGGAA